MSKRFLIFSAAFGHTNPIPKTFLQSAKHAGIDADIVLLRHCREESVEKELKSYYPNTYVIAPMRYMTLRVVRRFLLATKLAPSVAKITQAAWKSNRFMRARIESIAPYLLGVMAIRFFIARAFLAEKKDEYSAVLLIDSRDVIFQDNPLNGFEGGLLVGEENCVIAEQHFNRDWLQAIYGESPKTLEELFQKRVICAGVTMGTTAQVLAYLDRMCEEFIKQLPRLTYRELFDQAVHNKILYVEDHKLDVRLTNNTKGIVANLATSDLSEFGEDWSSGVRTKNGDVVSILHQYDRHPALTEALITRLGSEPSRKAVAANH